MESNEEPESNHEHSVLVGRTELTLQQLGMLQSSVPRLMLEVSARFSRGYHAGKAKNARLARFQIGEGAKLLRLCAVVQPRYADAISQFMTEQVEPLRELLGNEQWNELDSAWDELTKEVNRWHDEFDHGFLVWKVSNDPPSDLDLSPQG
ncbi:MAG: hypothetical protein J2O47_00935 [Acidimicrobiaceae bacterium]|nr:hypothetical protein [Acidimicrobiaceae bacterium]